MAIEPGSPEEIEALDRRLTELGTSKPTEIDITDPWKTTTRVSGGSFNINSFRSEIIRNDILPTHSFLVVFAPFTRSNEGYNTPLTRFVVDNPGTLIMRCDTAFLPGPTLMTENIRRYTYGPNETVPNGVLFGDITLEWIVDRRAKIFQFFDAWMNTIVNFNSRGGGDMVTQTNGYAPYEIGYKDEYSNRQMNIFVYDRQQRKTVVYTLYDVFPIQINDVNVAWRSTGEAMKYTVRFAYTDYKLETPQIEPLLSESVSSDLSAFKGIVNNDVEDKYGLRGSSQVSILTPSNDTTYELIKYFGNDSGTFPSTSLSQLNSPFRFG